MDELDCTLHVSNSPTKEYSAIPLSCWNQIDLSEIWIPLHLLVNRNVSNVIPKRNFSVFHTLEKRGSLAESFSTYQYNEDAAEIFYSDSDKNSVSSTEFEVDKQQPVLLRKREDEEFLSSCPNKLTKRKKDKKKKKEKNLLFEELFGGVNKEEENERGFKKYYENYVKEASILKDGLPLKNNNEFPNLANGFDKQLLEESFSKEAKSEQKKKTVPKIDLKDIAALVADCAENNGQENISEPLPEIELHEPCIKNLILENIPDQVTSEDICSVLSGYGEIINFTVIRNGDNFTADVELDLNCDMDWIIDCLNGSELFGVSCEPLKCYEKCT